MGHSAQEQTAPTAGAAATLESAVNEWATTGPAQQTVTDTGAVRVPSTSAAIAGPPPLPPSGWYPDPAGGSNQRYWDGLRWTEQTTPAPPSP
jgi:hypothetical protein